MKHFSLIIFLLVAGLFPALTHAKDSFLNDFPIDEITEDIYVIHGPISDPSPENQGFINNPAFVVVDTGVVVIDPGSSRSVGEMVLKKISQVTQLPVIAIFNTHVHGDHWLGNQAILKAYPGIPVYAHPKMLEATANGAGQRWLSLMNQMTDNSITGTEVVAPTHKVKHGDELTLGNRTFRIHHYGTSHTNNDIMIEVVESKTVFLGDNAFIERLPRLDDGDVLGNIHSLENILKTNSEFYIPGHGPSGGRQVVETYKEYLTTLHNEVKRYYEEGLFDYEMKDQIIAAMQEFSDWYGFETYLGKNISIVYLQVESDDF